MSDWGWDLLEYFAYKSDEDLRMIWCPKCNKMLTNEYLRCNRCGEIFDTELVDKFESVDAMEKEKQRLFDQGSYRQAIDVAYIIIEVARQIGDKHLEEEQREFINNALSKIKLKIKEAEIKARVVDIKKNFEEFVEQDNIVEAHRIVVDFKQEFEDVRELLMKIDVVRELIIRDKELWDEHLAKDVEQPEEKRPTLDDLKEQVMEILKKSKAALIDGKLGIVFSKHQDIVKLLKEANI